MHMTKIAIGFRHGVLLTAIATMVFCNLAQGQAPAFQSIAELRSAALTAMGSADLRRLEFSAEGWEACLGQPWRISDGWARWELSDYRRVIDYSTLESLQSAQRRAGMDPEALGGCGAQPGAAPAAQQSSLSAASAWPNQLPLWLTPQGFLELAARNSAAVEAVDDGWTVSFTTTQDGIAYPLRGEFDSELLLQRIETRLDNSVYGDMLVEAEFSDYREFDGLLFPATLVQKQGGFAVLSLNVTDVIPNSTASAQPPAARNAGGGGAAPALPEESLSEIAPGIYLSPGAYQAVIVEMDAAVVVIDGLQSDARSERIIAQTKATIPDKAVRYVISTHNHFDHASGLRAFIEEGATLITHKMNAEFFRTALAAPRTLIAAGAQQAATAGLPPQPVEVLGIGDTFVLSDPSNRIELYRLQGSLHADDMLIAYLPAISTVVEADVLQPWINPGFGGGRDTPHPFLVHLADELERLGLDYTQFIPIHKPTASTVMSKAELMTAIGRTAQP